MPSTDWRAELARARRFSRRLDRKDPLAPIPPPALPPGRVVDVPDRGEMFVRDTGPLASGDDRPTIVLLHGWTASADLNWLQVYGRLSALGRVIAMDHRGHGRGIRSEQPFTLEDAADDVGGLLRTLGTGPCILVGYSMGGPISMLTWLRARDVVAGLVLEATALEWRATARERIVWKFMAFLEYFLRLGTPSGILERALRDAVEQNPDLEPMVPWLKGELRRADPTALADAGRALGSYDFRPHAPTVEVPTTVVVTTKDRLVRPRKQRQLAKAIPASQRIELAGDHDAALVLGADFARVTEDAIRSVLSRVASGGRLAS